MKILVTGGGTAGHINPALAIASYFKTAHKNAQILYIGNKGGMEEKLVPPTGYEFKSITISGFQRKLSPKNIVKNIRTVYRLFSSSSQAKKLIKDFSPDFCIGTGGYVSGPVIREAAKLGIPCFLHESNAYPGVTVKLLAKSVKAVMLPVESAKNHFPPEATTVVTGNPVRSSFSNTDKQEARRKLNLDDRPVILSFGGSLGAKTINTAMKPLLERSSKDSRYQHIHGYGLSDNNRDYKSSLKLNPNSNNVSVLEYISNMQDCFAAADLIISRAGAITVAEISAMGRASILIPSPNVSENHQFHNAMSLVNIGGAEVIEEKNLTPLILMEKVDNILETKQKTQEISQNAKKLYIENSLELIYNTVMKSLK